jgi:hypothetical protein
MRLCHIHLFVVALALTLVLAVRSSALPTQTGSASTTGFTVASGLGDLADGLTPTANNIALLGMEGTNNNPKVLTDGSFGSPDNSNPGSICAIGDGAVLTFTLNTTASPNGFRLNQVESYCGWRDGGRDAQNYTVSYSTILAPNVFIPITTVAYNPAGSSPSDSKVVVQDTTLGFLATAIAKVQFSFPNPPGQENGYVGYREFDLMGVWLPEPTCLSAVLLGAAGLLGRRRRVR